MFIKFIQSAIAEMRSATRRTSQEAESLVISPLQLRPDRIADEYLDILADIRDRFQKDIYIELGLQAVEL